MAKSKVFFPNLNGLRFIAVFAVIIHHIVQFKYLHDIESIWETSPVIKIIGKLGVVLFFVLSGFLITYLLLVEEKDYGSIDIRKFYLRRGLRIWPLYFFIIILAFGIIPNISIFEIPSYTHDWIYEEFLLKITLYIIMMPNLVLSLFGDIPYLAQTWSIGTEEQFYLVWPVLLIFFKKNRLTLMLSVILGYILLKAFLSLNISDFIIHKQILRGFWSKFPIDCMAIGGIFAVILFEKNGLLKYIQNSWMFYLCLVLVLLLISNGVYIPNFQFEFYGILFGVIILNFASNLSIKISLEYNWLNYLGSISFGLYIYHPIAIKLALIIADKLDLMTNWFLIPVSFLITIVFAELSFRYLETYFLNYKKYFTKVKSGDDVAENVIFPQCK